MMAARSFHHSRFTPPHAMPEMFPEAPPQPRKQMAGYAYGDEVWLWEANRAGQNTGQTAGQPETRRKARVIAVLLSLHQLTLRTDDNRLVSLNPLVHGAMITKRSSP